MTSRKSVLFNLALAAVAPCAWQSLVHAQPAQDSIKAQGQFRDAAVDTPRGQFFVAVYDRDAVWAIDPGSGEIAARINVGDGPANLAVDRDHLAVANRLSNTVTVIRLADLSVAGTAQTGSGPSAIVALGDGRFVTTNSFDDSLSLIDARSTVSSLTIKECPSVPSDVAVTESYVAVVGRAVAQIQLYDRQTLTPLRSIPLPESATRVSSLPGDRLAVASQTDLRVIDAENGTVVNAIAMRTDDLATSGDTIWAISGAKLDQFDLQLNLLDSRTLETPASTIASEGAVIALLDPRGARATVQNLSSLTSNRAAPAAIAPPQPTPETAPEKMPVTAESGDLVVVEAAPVGAPAASTRAPEPIAPATIEPVGAREPEALPETNTVEPAPLESPSKPTESSDVKQGHETVTPLGSASVRRNPIVTDSVRAPSTGRPSASPLHQLSRKTITEALVQPTEFGSTTGGFQAPDLTKDLENIKAANISSAGNGAPTVFSDFRAQLGDLTMSADNLTHTPQPVDLHAQGNVVITQQSSSITADEIHFRLDQDEAAATAQPKILEGGEEQSPALDNGHLTLNNAHVIEPTREMTADYMDYDFKTGKGELTNATGKAGIYYFSADKLHLHGPESLSGENVWVTTCDRVHPHYKIRLSELELVDGQPTAGSNARLQLGKMDTPLYLPRWRRGGVGGSPWTIDFDSGRQADIGYFVNVGQSYEISPDVSLGPRLFVTSKEGIGFGADFSYNFMENPASRFYRTQGEAHSLYTTEDRGYVHWYHRYEYSNDLIVRAQVEHWGDENFYKDFYYDAFRNRSQPRSFANITYRQPKYIATATARVQSHGWFSETEQAPEATFHWLEKPLAENLYFSFDTANGYYNREPSGVGGGRSANTARLTYSWDPRPGVAITPFWEVDGYLYTRDRQSNSATGVLSTNLGVTAQTRLHRTYAGRWGFSAFKHMIVPSITYSYRPDTSVEPLDIPQYDPLDSIFGRSRIETKLSNVLYGRDAETGEVWQVGRLTFYQGNDLRNERRATEDYEIELDVRPRPWWGVQVVGERQITSDADPSLSRLSIARNFPRFYRDVVGEYFGSQNARDFSGQFGDFNRALAQFYYDGEPRGEKISGRFGFAHTKTQDEVFNREILYGLGYKINDNWGFGFEHTYDFEENHLRSQTYELRRSLHCWETAIRFRDRESGFDINLEFNIKAFPGSRLKL